METVFHDLAFIFLIIYASSPFWTLLLQKNLFFFFGGRPYLKFLGVGLNFEKGGEQIKKEKDHFPWRFDRSNAYHLIFVLLFPLLAWLFLSNILSLDRRLSPFSLQFSLCFVLTVVYCILLLVTLPFIWLFPLNSWYWTLNLRNIFEHLFQVLCLNILKLWHCMRNDEY
jgi:hypothetical protein